MNTAPMTSILQKLKSTKQVGDGQWTARCPAHDDQNASLTIGIGDDKRVLLHCFAGCDLQVICSALEITPRDLFHRSNGSPTPETPYSYHDESHTLLYQVVRKPGKKFAQRRPDGNGKWIWNLKGVRRVLYRLPELLAADPELLVFIPEGEKDVENLRSRGLIATCNSGGAGKWRDEYSQFLQGRIVIVLADNDEAGRRHAQQVAKSLHGIAAEVRIVLLPGLAEGGDVSDWLAGGGTVDELNRIAEAAHLYEPAESAEPATTPVVASMRLSKLCDDFLASLDPEWHRDHRSIYFAQLNRIVTLPNLWTLSDDSIVDMVSGTVEGLEIAQSGSEPKYRVRLSLFEKAIRIAGARLLARLPAVVDVPQDATLDREALLDRLIQWMLRERTFRTDTGNPVTLNYHGWATGLEQSDSWHRCFGAAVFGRINSSDGRPRVAVKGQTLSGDLRYESSRRLAADLRTAGLADTDRTIKVTRVTWRVWVLDLKVIDTVSGGDAE